ncbi:MAG TPA: PAS domain-containing sensor histidine kinase [Cyanobacteria bacterium UBA8803]|nr:PAS domain-containing sensor histidine kinase [Cyanobacteria bacterium UBA9273]HBL59502.1 PAS domain-containing sensor histidine kinase [Cyanobacteria bacterium UBA8803]
MDAKEFLTHWEKLIVETNCNGFEGIRENRDKKNGAIDLQVLAKNSASEIHYRKIIKELSDFKFALDQAAIVAITDQHGIIRYVNDKFCELSKYSREELIGQNHRIIKSGYHPPEFFQKFWETIKAGQVWKGEIKNKAKDGTYYWVDTTVVPFLDETGKPYQYLSIRFDITERKQAEEALRQSELIFRQQARELELALVKLKHTQSQLVQSEKMSTVGQLIAGIAHEINNPVNFIYGNLHHASEYSDLLIELLHLYQRHYPASVPEIQKLVEDHDLEFLLKDLPKCLDSMQLGANRIREIVLSLRNFSRLDEPNMKPVNIHEGLDSTLLILQNRLKGKPGHPEITLIKEYGDLPPVTCYGSQLNQVFMNIICNAIDALENQPAPREIAIRTSVRNGGVENGEREKQENPQFAVISIANSGPAIPEEIQQHLFDPFFTTKAMGKGTGLGLSIAYHIVVEKHQGQLKCISQLGAGVEFAIAIPLSPCP